MSVARRRLNQELGITGYKFSELYRFEYHATYLDLGSENELCTVLICRSDDRLTINPTEVSAIRWISLPSLEVEIESQPHHFTPWSKLEIKQLASSFFQKVHEMYI